MSPHRTAPRPPVSRTALLAACLAAAGVLLAPAAPRAGAADGPGAAVLLGRLRTAYQRAERAADAYDAARERLAVRQREDDRLAAGLGADAARVRAARAAVGTLARERYRAAVVSPYARLLLADDPRTALSQLRVLGQAQAAQDLTVRRALGAAAALSRGRAREARALKPVRDAAARAAAERDRTADALASAEDAIASAPGTRAAGPVPGGGTADRPPRP